MLYRRCTNELSLLYCSLSLSVTYAIYILYLYFVFTLSIYISSKLLQLIIFIIISYQCLFEGNTSLNTMHLLSLLSR